MRKAVSLVLEDDELIELIGILMDGDAAGALVWLKAQFKGKGRDLLEGG